MALPVLGANAINMAQLTPEVRKYLKQRATGAARREWAPVLAADRAAFEIPRAAYRTQAAATRGASQMTEDMLLNALAGLKSRGLQGTALQQAQGEITSRIGDSAQAIPFLLADAADERATGISEARQQLLEHQGQMRADAASGFNSYLDEARNAAESELEQRKNERAAAADTAQSGGLDLSPETVQQAELELKGALRKWSENPTIETPDGEEMNLQQWNPLRTDQDWARFAEELSKEAKSAGLVAINEIIERVRRAGFKRERPEG